MTNLQYCKYGSTTILLVPCFACGETSEMRVRTKDFENYARGMLVQDAFPTMSIENREIIVSGMCKECQEKYFNEEEDI